MSFVTDNTTIVFYTSDALISRVIRWFTRSKCSHAALSYEWEGVPMILHATASGVRGEPRAHYEKSSRVVEEYLLPECDYRRRKLAIHSIGRRYDYPNLLFRAAAILAWRWLRLQLRTPWVTPRSVVCSEFIQRLGYHQFYHLNPERCTAQDLLEICQEAPWARVA